MKITPKSGANGSKRRAALRWIVALAGVGVVGGVAAIAGVIGAYYYVSPALPAAETIRDIPLEVPLRIYTRDGLLIEEIGERRRVPITYDEVPDHVVEAFIAAEDQRFFVHPGIDYRGVLRAFSRFLMTGNTSGGGGSTLTQQLARSYFLSLAPNLDRKFKEAALAVRIEREFTKEQIMELFLNKMFFGQRAYGVAAAAQVYFNKPLEELSIAEAATLAGVLPAPSRYNPVTSAEKAFNRRGYVLGRMRALDFITNDQYAEAMDVPMESTLHGAAIEVRAPYVAEMVRRNMLNRFGDATYTDGYQVVTTLDSELQVSSDYAMRNGLLEFTRRRGYRGPLANLALADEQLAAPIDEWPVEARQALDRYVPGGLNAAVVTAVNDNNTVDIRLANGDRDTIPWAGLSWAKPFIDPETTGAAPETAADVLAPADLIIVMPTNKGTWALAQEPQAQSAIVSMDPGDGAISSLSGGFDFVVSKFNRATQSARQPGSSFKPFIYSAALEHGNTAATVILDAPVVIRSSELEAVWRPINYSGRFYGPTRMREALVRSMNLVSVRLLLFETGIGNAVRHIERFGFGGAALPRNGSLALGAGAASPLDMVQGYAVFANGGYGVRPYVVEAIYDSTGEAVYRADPAIVCEACFADPDDDALLGFGEEETLNEEQRLNREHMLSLIDFDDVQRDDVTTAPEIFEHINAAPRVISEQNAFLISDMMRDVILRGTGRRAMALGRRDLSGKTGTSNDQRDAWFGGFNADLAAVVWVGYDEDKPLGPGEEGSKTALPIWIEFMRNALDGAPEHQLRMPDGMVNVRIDPVTGCPSRNGIWEVFRQGNEPTCDDVEGDTDPFNNSGAIEEPVFTQPDAEGVADDDAEEEEPEDESLF
ncbi:MAG: PBP1A family penicillin-binding protein [Pseudomonadota bacterium]